MLHLSVKLDPKLLLYNLRYFLFVHFTVLRESLRKTIIVVLVDDRPRSTSDGIVVNVYTELHEGVVFGFDDRCHCFV